jgi:hypothetical protein
MNIKLLDFKKLKDFPSGTAIEMFNDQLYLVGNRSGDVSIFSKNWKLDDTIHLFSFATKNVSPVVKTNFEASTVVNFNKTPFLFIVETGSPQSAHNKGILINLKSRKLEEIDLSPFYNRLKLGGFEELNIQAIGVVDDKMLLYTTGNKQRPDNRLVVTSVGFWKNQQAAEFYTIKLELEDKPDELVTFSGLTYSYQNDWLILTALSGETDGIGESFLYVIEDVSRKIGRKRLKFNDTFNISALDKKLNKLMIKSVGIQADKEKRLKLHLSAVDENEETFLVKIRLKD